MSNIWINDKSALARCSDSVVTVSRLRKSAQRDRNGRIAWKWSILDGDLRSVETATADTMIYTGANGVGDDSEQVLSSLLSFLMAAAEAKDESSENWTLFGGRARKWAKEYSDEVQMASIFLADEEGIS